jgi:TusA-related sulfurtransferase
VTRSLDLTGVLCPMNWVRAKLELERLASGETLELLVDPGEAIESVPRMAGEDGHGVSVSGNLVTIVKA